MFDSLAIFGTVALFVILAFVLGSMAILGIYAKDKAELDAELDRMHREAVRVSTQDAYVGPEDQA